MIDSVEAYRDYLRADAIANKVRSRSDLLFSPTWRYIKILRWNEYLVNCLPKNMMIFGRILCKYANFRLRRISVRTGISIPINTFGKGLYLPHYGCIVVNSSARFGDYCIIQCGVNVSENVVCGDHIYLGAGAKLLIGVKLESGTIVGANAVVTKSFTESNIVIAGIPANVISRNGMLSNREKV